MQTPTVIDLPLRFAHAQIVLGDVPMLIDAGTPGDVPRILAAITRAGLQPRDVKRIILTHADGDHAGGAVRLQEITGAEIAAHVEERSYLEGELPAGFGWVKRAVIALGGRALGLQIARWLKHGDVVDGMEVLHTPGHTAGHISLVAGSVLVAGDAFTTGDRCKESPRFMSADVPLSRQTIRWLAERDISTAFSGHGAPVADAGAKLRALAAKLPP